MSFWAIQLLLLLDPQDFTYLNVETKDFSSLSHHCEGKFFLCSTVENWNCPLSLPNTSLNVLELTFKAAVQAAFWSASLPETGKNWLVKLNPEWQKICKASFRKGISTIPRASAYKRKPAEKERELSVIRGSLRGS